MQAGPEIANKICPYCRTNIGTGRNVVVCDGPCKMPHHAECWSHNGGCTTFGCPFAPGQDSQPVCAPVRSNAGHNIVMFLAGNSTYESVRSTHVPENPGSGRLCASEQSGRSASNENHIWVWALFGGLVLALLIGLALSLSPRQDITSAAVEPDIPPTLGQSPSSSSAGSAALSYLHRGLGFLGFDDPSGSELQELILDAAAGNTQNLDDAERCFRACIAQASVMRPGETVPVTGESKENIMANAHLCLGYSACIRAILAEAAGYHSVASQWMREVDRQLQAAQDCEPSIDTAPLRRLVSELE